MSLEPLEVVPVVPDEYDTSTDSAADAVVATQQQDLESVLTMVDVKETTICQRTMPFDFWTRLHGIMVHFNDGHAAPIVFEDKQFDSFQSVCAYVFGNVPRTQIDRIRHRLRIVAIVATMHSVFGSGDDSLVYRWVLGTREDCMPLRFEPLYRDIVKTPSVGTIFGTCTVDELVGRILSREPDDAFDLLYRRMRSILHLMCFVRKHRDTHRRKLNSCSFRHHSSILRNIIARALAAKEEVYVLLENCTPDELYAWALPKMPATTHREPAPEPKRPRYHLRTLRDILGTAPSASRARSIANARGGDCAAMSAALLEYATMVETIHKQIPLPGTNPYTISSTGKRRR